MLRQYENQDRRSNRIAGGISTPSPDFPACGAAPGGSQEVPDPRHDRNRVQDSGVVVEKRKRY